MTALAHVTSGQLDDARRVLRILTAAYPSYPVGDDTAELYLGVICADLPDFATASRVALDWSTSELYFPKPVELVERYNAEVERARRRASTAQRSRRDRGDGTFACRLCEDARYVATKITGVGGKVYDAVAPCRNCEPEEREYWEAGHYDNDHDVFSCEHPRCEARAGARSKRHRQART